MQGRRKSSISTAAMGFATAAAMSAARSLSAGALAFDALLDNPSTTFRAQPRALSLPPVDSFVGLRAAAKPTRRSASVRDGVAFVEPVSSNGAAVAAASVAAPKEAEKKTEKASGQQPQAGSSPQAQKDFKDMQTGGVGQDSTCSVTVVGASGDLAKKKIFPALFALFYEGYLPKVSPLP